MFPQLAVAALIRKQPCYYVVSPTHTHRCELGYCRIESSPSLRPREPGVVRLGTHRLSTYLLYWLFKTPRRLSNGNESLINRPNHSLIGTGPGWVGPGVNSHAAHQGQRQACSSNPRASSPPSAQPHPSRAGAGQPGVLQQSGLIVGDFYLVVS